MASDLLSQAPNFCFKRKELFLSKMLQPLFAILLTFPLCSTATTVDQDCFMIPPALWCQDMEIAKKCGVEKQCQDYFKETTEKKLQLTLFFESLCPDCQRFIKGPLKKLYDNFSDYVNIEWVPYGNAKLVNGSIKCQHDELECNGNRFESCVVENFVDPFNFIHCFEGVFNVRTTVEDAANKCYDQLKINIDQQNKLSQCYSSNHSHDLQLWAARRTQEVWPQQHKFVPHVLFNNVSVNGIQALTDSISGLVCSWLGGKPPMKCVE